MPKTTSDNQPKNRMDYLYNYKETETVYLTVEDKFGIQAMGETLATIVLMIIALIFGKWGVIVVGLLILVKAFGNIKNLHNRRFTTRQDAVYHDLLTPPDAN